MQDAVEAPVTTLHADVTTPTHASNVGALRDVECSSPYCFMATISPPNGKHDEIVLPLSTIGSDEIIKPSDAKPASASSPSSPLSAVHKATSLRWNELCMSIGDVRILKNTWGVVESGKLCAIMGPSGSGKSSMMNVLAGRVSKRCTVCFIDLCIHAFENIVILKLCVFSRSAETLHMEVRKWIPKSWPECVRT